MQEVDRDLADLGAVLGQQHVGQLDEVADEVAHLVLEVVLGALAHHELVKLLGVDLRALLRAVLLAVVRQALLAVDHRGLAVLQHGAHPLLEGRALADELLAPDLEGGGDLEEVAEVLRAELQEEDVQLGAVELQGVEDQLGEVAEGFGARVAAQARHQRLHHAALALVLREVLQQHLDREELALDHRLQAAVRAHLLIINPPQPLLRFSLYRL